MTELKSLCAKIDVELHNKIREEQIKTDMQLNVYLEHIIKEYFEMKEKGFNMDNKKTLAIQVEPEFMERIKNHLKLKGMTQKAFLISVIEDALKETE